MNVQTPIEIGSEFVGYRLDELVGRGGMGVVYRASDLRLKRTVALKLMAPELALDERFRERFARESELAMSLEHPNVVPIHDAGEANGRLYLAMRFVEGTDLKALLRGTGALAPARALAIVSRIGNALDAAHSRGLVHRDVKPSNVLLDADEHVYLADFGLTRRLGDQGLGSSDGRSLGTPAYLAPEQIEGAEVDHRADIYSLGCLLYECLTGEAPFERGSRLAVAWAHLEEEPPSLGARNPALPAAIDAVIAKAMAKEPGDRYGSCAELTAAAREALDLQPAGHRRRRLVLAGVVAAALAGVAVLASAFVDRSGETAAPASKVRANTILRIDPATNAIDEVIEVGKDPFFTASGGNTVWVYNHGGRSISEVDAASSKVQATTAIGTEPNEGGWPMIAADAEGAWLIGHRPGTRPVQSVLTKIRSGGAGIREFPLDVHAKGVAVTEGAVWVPAWDPARSDVLLRIDRDTGKVARTQIPGFGQVETIAAGGGAIWILDSNAELFRIDPRSGRVTGRRDLGECAAPPVFGFGSLWICACNPGSAMIRLDPRTLRPRFVRNAIPAQYGLFAVGRDSVWWHDERTGTVLRFDPEDGDLERTIRVSPEPPTPGEKSLNAASIATAAGAVWVTAAVFDTPQ
jgi:streptogramin lyase